MRESSNALSIIGEGRTMQKPGMFTTKSSFFANVVKWSVLAILLLVFMFGCGIAITEAFRIAFSVFLEFPEAVIALVAFTAASLIMLLWTVDAFTRWRPWKAQATWCAVSMLFAFISFMTIWNQS